MMENGNAGLDINKGLVIEGRELFDESIGEYDIAVLVYLFGGGKMSDVVLLLLRSQLLVLFLPFRLLIEVLVEHGSCFDLTIKIY